MEKEQLPVKPEKQKIKWWQRLITLVADIAAGIWGKK
jgi:hypothetical protein